MKLRFARSFLKSLPVFIVVASGHVALAEQPLTVVEPLRSVIVFDRTEAELSAGNTKDGVDPEVPSEALTEVTSTIATAGRIATAPPPDARQVECVAKVVLHEAGNQPLRGRMAVAQVIRSRVRDGRFGPDACSVVAQPGQFFDVDAYEPSRATSRWADAIEVAQKTLSGQGEEVAPGALFFHSAGASMKGRRFVAQVADHFFYR